MVSDIMSSVIIQYSPPAVNEKREILPGNFFEESTVDITVWTTLWIMCKSPFPEGLWTGDGPL
jgi:hypothetical protein